MLTTDEAGSIAYLAKTYKEEMGLINDLKRRLHATDLIVELLQGIHARVPSDVAEAPCRFSAAFYSLLAWRLGQLAERARKAGADYNAMLAEPVQGDLSREAAVRELLAPLGLPDDVLAGVGS